MCPAPQSPTGDVLDEEPARVTAPREGRVALIIDAQSGLLLDATGEGWAAWGLDPRAVTLPIAVDCAMPAIQRLRQMAQTSPAERPVSLTFWTARGLLQLDCCVGRREADGGSAMLVTALNPPQVAAAKPAARQPGLARRGRGLELDVALDAWLAHELRTPLSAVIAYAEILKTEHFGPLANPRYKSYACDIYNSARHALGVVDSMLQGDRARTALPALSFVDLDPAVVIEDCLAVARPLAERAGLELAADLPACLPRIVADELSLRQMLLNLLSNAIKFARAGDRVAVLVAYDCDGPLTISVADTGPGMDAAPKGDRTGLGLGLPLTRALAAANGARLAVESGPGRGTRVTIAFGKDRLVPV